MRVITILAVCLAAVAAAPSDQQRIMGGSLATISQYPTIAALLHSWNLSTYWQACGGVIINSRSILTAAHCPDGDTVNRWRIRVGSSYGNSGGVVANVASYVMHASYNRLTRDNDIAMLRTATTLSMNNNVRAATIAGPNYYLADNQIVWAAGWGETIVGGQPSEQLRHVQIWTINQNTCTSRYSELRRTITANMLCSGWLDVGGRDQCLGDAGGPLYHNGIVVGIASWGESCGLARYPHVNTRISRYTSWIQSNA